MTLNWIVGLNMESNLPRNSFPTALCTPLLYIGRLLINSNTVTTLAGREVWKTTELCYMYILTRGLLTCGPSPRLETCPAISPQWNCRLITGDVFLLAFQFLAFLLLVLRTSPLSPASLYTHTISTMFSETYFPMAPANSVPRIQRRYHYEHFPQPSDSFELMEDLRRGLRGAPNAKGGFWSKAKSAGWRFLGEWRFTLLYARSTATLTQSFDSLFCQRRGRAAPASPGLPGRAPFDPCPSRSQNLPRHSHLPCGMSGLFAQPAPASGGRFSLCSPSLFALDEVTSPREAATFSAPAPDPPWPAVVSYPEDLVLPMGEQPLRIFLVVPVVPVASELRQGS